MSQIQLLIVSDAVSSPTGLARVARELAVRIHTHLSDTFELATAGYGGTYSRKFPWKQYSFQKLTDWTIPELPGIWQDFAGDRKGIILWVWNASWLPWLANPDLLPPSDLKTFLQSGQFENWIYVPVDAEGPYGKMVESQGEILKKFDRVLAYTKFGADVIDRTCGWEEGTTAHLPHGTDGTVFYPRDRHEARQGFVARVTNQGTQIISDDVLLAGCVATNTARKDWGLAFETCAELLRKGVNIGLWAHTDRFQKAWDLLSLADEFGMRERVIFTNGHLSDEDMAWAYAACDCVLAIGSGEGWGLSSSEALACGIPAITGDYAGAAEFTPQGLKITPVGYRYEGYYANKRPVFRAMDWANRVLEVIQPADSICSLLNSKYFWGSCWQKWAAWLLEGVHGKTQGACNGKS